jgi:hypothetical protein
MTESCSLEKTLEALTGSDVTSSFRLSVRETTNPSLPPIAAGRWPVKCHDPLRGDVIPVGLRKSTSNPSLALQSKVDEWNLVDRKPRSPVTNAFRHPQVTNLRFVWVAAGRNKKG